MAENSDRIDAMIATCTNTRIDITKQLGAIRSELAALKVKASVWGLFGGLIPVLVALGALLLRG